MTMTAVTLIGAGILGLGATLTFDICSLVLKYAFHIAPSNICLVGRWLRHMPEGIFVHSNIAAAPRKTGECGVGWIAHYAIGVTFAVGFVSIAGAGWLRHPTPLPAIFYGAATVLAPYLIMQPAFGLGVAAARAPNPAQARLRSLFNHLAFGTGLYLSALLLGLLLVAFNL